LGLIGLDRLYYSFLQKRSIHASSRGLAGLVLVGAA
jgi:hypothetical protein